ncbi:MAG TPA: sialate O-acetylesterase, partial [Chitinophagaceae bacterium]|nr:sialate O-acetylesterase [Chitinophagaceae bacterium]
MKKNHSSFFLITISLLSCFIARANVRIPSILGSHMVLQQNSQACFWGWANPGEKIKIMVDWDTSLYHTQSSGEGKWQIKIPTGKAGGPYKVFISGNNAIVLEDVMIGEVWVCSGQSNMERSGDQQLQQSIEEAPHANNTKIRFFYIPKTTAAFPQDNCGGSWQVCSPEEMIHFSAIGYFFGKRLQQDLKVPVGLINSNWGGTPAETWTPENKVMENTELAAAAAKQEKNPWWPVKPGLLYNAMIYPITPFPIAGVIWYQGESNTSTAYAYKNLFSTMIESWRQSWGKKFPFYYVQIAPFAYRDDNVGAQLR